MRIGTLVLGTMVGISSSALISTSAQPTPQPILLAEEGHKHSEDEKQKLGRQKIGDYTVSVIMVGDIHDDKEIDFDVKLIDAKSDPKALRIWIGAEDGAGSEKATLVKKKTTFGGKAKVPNPVPKDAKVWVEVETDAGTAKGSYAINDKHDHKH